MRLKTQITVITLLRVILNTAFRMVYPFLSVFAAGLGVDATAVSFALTGRNAAGIFGPILAPLADQRGRRFGLLAGIAAFTAGVALVAVHPSLLTFIGALILSTLGKSLFDPALQAYFGDRVPYEQRGTALAITEMAWSLAFIVGVPAMGFLIARYGWSAPFPALTILGAIAFAIMWRMIPREAPHSESLNSPFANLKIVIRSIPALAGVSIALWAAAANEMVNLNFGLWLSDSFHLQIAALAGASAVIGAAELGGEGLVALITDRIGKPLAVLLGLSVNVLACILLPWIGHTETGALAGLFLFYISFEYVVVSQIPMMTEAVPDARATVMALNLVGFGIGRSLGAFLSTLIYNGLGFLVVTMLAVFFNILAILALAEMQRKINILPRVISWLGISALRSD